MGKSANGGEGLGDGAWGRLVALLAGSARWTWLWAFRAGFLGLKVWICVAWFWGDTKLEISISPLKQKTECLPRQASSSGCFVVGVFLSWLSGCPFMLE